MQRKWRWSRTEFEWKDEKGVEDFLANIKEHGVVHYGVGMSDPAGITMDCATLHNAAHGSLGDFERWYADAVQLAKTVEANKEMLRVTDQATTEVQIQGGKVRK